VITGLISPYIKDRQEAKQSHEKSEMNFKECYIKASVEACEKRDVKGLYKKAREGEVK